MKLLLQINEPLNAYWRRLVPLSSELVWQRPISLLAVVARRIETVQPVLRCLVVARAQTDLGRPYTRNVASIAGHWRLSLGPSRLCSRQLAHAVHIQSDFKYAYVMTS